MCICSVTNTVTGLRTDGRKIAVRFPAETSVSSLPRFPTNYGSVGIGGAFQRGKGTGS